MKTFTRPQNRAVPAIALLAAAVLATAPAVAEDEEEPKLGWFDVAEFSLLASSGNSEVQTISLRNTATRFWESSSLEIVAGGIRAQSTTTSRVAVGSPTDFLVRKSSETALTAENYFLRGRYDREVEEKLFWFAGLGWDRNEFAGIDSRIGAFGGVGHLWFERDSARFQTDYGVTYTDQEDVSGATSRFAGLRLSYEYWRQLNDATGLTSTLAIDENLDDTEDYRADFVNTLSVAMSERLALKASLQLLFDNRPALTEILLIPSISGGSLEGSRVLAELDSLDSILTVSLVANF
ncbi:MAG: DUF481 domain-containing protein [Acidobacteria bacterium]|nr:DUF481 domain-containing protein [Acidobacteriota bacterium]